MKLRDPQTIQRVAKLGSMIMRAWIRTLSCAYRPLGGRYVLNDRPECLGNARYLYAFWHEYLFVPSYLFARPDTAVMVGTHADGELITQIIERFGFHTVRGSSTRQGTTALLRILRDGTTRHFALTPDGPKGPRRQCQFGAVYLASRTGIPLIPMGVGISRCKRVRSWDRFALPLPFARVRCVTGFPLHVPAGLSTAELEPHQQALTRAINHATAVAEHWAETRVFDPLGATPPDGQTVETSDAKAWSPARFVPRVRPSPASNAYNS